jgi:outer membrane immunogenic protein
MRGLLLATTAIVALGGQAFASDLLPAPMPVKVPVYQPAELFAGWYVGINAGYGWGQDKVNLSGADAPSQAAVNFLSGIGVPTSFSPAPSGFIGGGQVGYNFQYQGFVAGLETDLDWANLQGSSSWNNLGHKIAGIPSASLINTTDKLTWLGTTRARVGYAPTNNLLLYGTGGLAYGGVQTNGEFRFPPLDLTTANGSNTQIGWAAGAGVEYALADHWLVRAEWLHYDLGTTTWNVPVAKTPFTGVISTRTDGDIVRGGLSYRF